MKSGFVIWYRPVCKVAYSLIHKATGLEQGILPATAEHIIQTDLIEKVIINSAVTEYKLKTK